MDQETNQPHDEKMLAQLDEQGRVAYQKYTETQNIEDLEVSIEIYQSIFQQAPDHIVYADSFMGLLQKHYERTSSLKDLEWLERTILHTLKNTENPEDRAMYALRLGHVYKEQYRLKRDLFALANSIYYAERAITAQQPERKADALYLLGLLLRERGSATENPEEIRKALTAWKSVLYLPLPEDKVNELLINTGALYRQLFELSLQRKDVEEAISFFQLVVEKLPQNAVLVDSLSFLSYSLYIHYDWSQDIKDLDQAVAHLEQALEIAKEPEKKAATLYNLGHTLQKRYKVTGKHADLQRARGVLDESKEIEKS